MSEKAEDINLPNSIIMRLMKEAIPDGINVSKETRTAFARAASVFILYLTANSNFFAVKAKRKTLMIDDVFQALDEIELGTFVEPIKEALELFRAEKLRKVGHSTTAPKKKKSAGEAEVLPEELQTEIVTEQVMDTFVNE